MSEYIPKGVEVWVAPETAVTFLAGDVVTRDGTDEHVVVRIAAGDNCMTVRCTKAPESGWTEVGEEEFNLVRRYILVRAGPARLQNRGDEP